jgi:hypothetical protein
VTAEAQMNEATSGIIDEDEKSPASILACVWSIGKVLDSC